jgi:cytidylate kinase
LGIKYIDTGAMYRALTLKALQEGIDPSNEDMVAALAETVSIDLKRPLEDGGEQLVFLDGTDVTSLIRSPAVNRNVSLVAMHPRVREAMVEAQRRLASGSVVMEGRDIGTKVLPEAEVKIFLTADFAERVRRRCRELASRGYVPDVHEVEAEVAMRDRIDSERETDPLRPAEDSFLLDSSGMTADEVAGAVLGLCEERIGCSTGSSARWRA